ncbi:MAG: hypothetical protein WBB85_20405, partial [Albidovulum sp.]|uniref:hypothetical protein n=1 Tax=Albidovulum sp. TaxID=1872424 RepID=UPI003CB57278
YDNSPFSVLELDSGGGRIDSAQSIGDFVVKNQIEVHVNGTCASACVIVALRARRLLALPEADFGFHRGSAIADTDSELGRFAGRTATLEMFKELRKGGIPDEILQVGQETSADSMYYVTGQKLHAAGVVDALIE